MLDEVTRARRRMTRLKVLALCGLLALAFGRTLLQTVLAASRPLPPGYTDQVPPGEHAVLKWNELRQGKWERGQKPSIAPAIAALDGKRATARGFMLPLHEPGEASQFFLAPQPGGCYFCNPPGVADIVMFKTAGGMKTTVTQLPVNIYGTFHVATGAADDESLYVIEDAVLVVKR